MKKNKKRNDSPVFGKENQSFFFVKKSVSIGDIQLIPFGISKLEVTHF